MPGNRTKVVRGTALLRAFIKTNGITAANAAEALGTNGSSVHYWLQGQVPRTRAQLAIAKWTGGAVPVEAWADRDSGLNPDKIVPFQKPATGTGG